MSSVRVFASAALTPGLLAGSAAVAQTGERVMVTHRFDSRLRQGMPVYIEGNGDGARVIPR